MTTAPHARNGNLAPDGPQLSSDDLYDYGTVVRLDRAGWAWRRVQGTGQAGWEGIDLATIASNVMQLPVDAADSHYVLTGCPDDDRRFWCIGNQHGNDFRGVVFPDHTADWTDPAEWEDAEPYFDVLAGSGQTGANAYSYSTFIPLPDGRLLLMVTQTDRTTSPFVLGRDVILLQLEPAASEWTAGPGTMTGEFAVCNETDDDGDPERAYFVGACVTPEGRVGWFGSWMPNHLDNFRKWPYYVELDSAAGDQWRTADGTAVTLPLTYNGTNATSTYSACELDTFDEITVSSYPAFDENGRPNIVLQESITNQRHRCYWTGSAWSNASGNSAGGLYLTGGGLWRVQWDSNPYVSIRPLATNSPVRLSGTTAVRFDPAPDPRRLWSGEVAFMVPDGNVPRTFSFGAGPRDRFYNPGAEEFPGWSGYGAPSLSLIGAPDDGDYTPWGPGDMVTTEDGQLIEFYEFDNGKVYIDHDNVTVRNCRFNNRGGITVEQDPARSGALIEYCTFDGGEDPGTQPAIGYARYTIRACVFTNYAEGPGAHGEALIEYCHVSQFVDYEFLEAHQDAVQTFAGVDNIVRFNTLICDAPVGNAAVQIGTAGDEVDNMLVYRNILGGGGYTVNCGYDAGAPPSGPDSNPTNVQIVENRFMTNVGDLPVGSPVGFIAIGPGNTVTGNVKHDGPNAGDPI